MSEPFISGTSISRTGPSTREWSISQQATDPIALYQMAASPEHIVTIINIPSRLT